MCKILKRIMTTQSFSEDEFDTWLSGGFSRFWPTSDGQAWMGHRVIQANLGHEMLLARVPVESCGECVYGEFRPSEDTSILLKGRNTLLLTFFIEGQILGFDGAPSGAALPFSPHSILLRRPNSEHGSRIEVRAGQRVSFLQLRLREDQWVSWMREAGLHPTSERLSSIRGGDGAVIYSTNWSANTYASLQPWGSIAYLRHATLPFLRAKSLELLTLFSTQWASGNALNTRNMSASQLARALHALIHADMSRRWSVVELCQTLACSPYMLDRACHVTDGQTAANCIREWKLMRAQSLLLSTQLPVSEIALRCGYLSGGRFAALYSKRFGQLPSGRKD
jgi:AraC-like DNA-binding protein